MRAKFKSKKKTNLILLILVVLIAVLPLLFNSGAEFGGADGEAEGLITEINPDYEPWFGSLYEPASGEIESLLFSVQAALGAGVIGYFLGKRKRD
ncbi:energy-coupling factor ABC transporter substrate-binding protein [Metaclostridioides mangenotii]|uniref:energy-coupling factor ABC transporter substrate-binding protein n=1 Tax=Metaclostridioides mangenotii TaxID=1540 RepID=UPI0004878626|nr:energy-coupling factor ABC transporter substrate-binding protein [Clostridioides mangenotii]